MSLPALPWDLAGMVWFLCSGSCQVLTFCPAWRCTLAIDDLIQVSQNSGRREVRLVIIPNLQIRSLKLAAVDPLAPDHTPSAR